MVYYIIDYSSTSIQKEKGQGNYLHSFFLLEKIFTCLAFELNLLCGCAVQLELSILQGY